MIKERSDVPLSPGNAKHDRLVIPVLREDNKKIAIVNQSQDPPKSCSGITFQKFFLKHPNRCFGIGSLGYYTLIRNFRGKSND